MKKINYDPLTYKPRSGTTYYTLSGSPFNTGVTENTTYGGTVPASMLGNYKKREHANLALVVVRKALSKMYTK